MKILHTLDRFYPHIGGVENYVLNYCKELIKKGITVFVICSNETPERLNEVNGIKVVRLKSLMKIANTNIVLSLPFKLIREKFEIMHTHLPTPWIATFSVLIAKLKKKPVVLSYYNDLSGISFLQKSILVFYTPLLHLILYLSDVILVLHKDYVRRSFILNAHLNKIKYLPPLIDTSYFQEIKNTKNTKKRVKKKDNIVGFLGILDQYHNYKGIDCLIKSINLIKKRIPNIKLKIGGTGALIPFYKSIVVADGLEKNVEFVGFVPQEELVHFYNSCKLVVAPSISKEEGYGIAPLEAMACGRPVVVTEFTGIAKLIKKYGGGIVVKHNDISRLAEAIVILLTNPSYYKSLCREARRLIKKYFSNTHLSNKLIKIYQGVIRKNA